MFTLWTHWRQSRQQRNPVEESELTKDVVMLTMEAAELDTELQLAHSQLEEAIQSEAFVAMRISSYEQLLQKLVSGDISTTTTTTATNSNTDTSESEKEPVDDDETSDNDVEQGTNNNNNNNSNSNLVDDPRILQLETSLQTTKLAHESLKCHVSNLRVTLTRLHLKRNAINTTQAKEYLSKVGMEGTNTMDDYNDDDDDDVMQQRSNADEVVVVASTDNGDVGASSELPSNQAMEHR